jgi:hypothetical protein
MDSTPIDASQLIGRYLAGQLPPEESDAFERSLCEHPEIRDETERTLRLKEGLARLRERGELNALLQAAPARRWPRYAVAAAVASLAFGILAWFYPRSPTPGVLGLSPSDFAEPHRESPSVLGIYELSHTRGAAPITDVRLPAAAGAIEFRIVPSFSSVNARLLARIKRLDGPANERTASEVDAGLVGPDGYVTLYVNSRKLTAGAYEVSLAPATATAIHAEPDRFVIRVR